MEKVQVEEILSCLKGERTLFHYTRDAYALQLLRDYVGPGMTVSELRLSPYAKLLNKTLVKQALAMAGGGKLCPEHLDGVLWQCQPLNFVLTLDQWGDERNSQREYCQMSRTGFNLVLQLNFANDHQQRYTRLVKDAGHAEFSYWSHPVITDGKHETLAWARIDLDFTEGQALIEEIQSDWVRQVKTSWNEACYENLPAYREQVLKPYAQVWDEAVLAASIQLIRHDLGIRDVFYNSFQTGNAMKGIRRFSLPPQSLYTDLPKRFAFTPTSEAPRFLQHLRQTRRVRNKQQDGAYWFKLPNQEKTDGKKTAACPH